MRVLHAGDDAEIREYMTGNICRIDHTSEINGYDRVKYAPARDISEHAVPASARVATSYPWVSSTFSERQALYWRVVVAVASAAHGLAEPLAILDRLDMRPTSLRNSLNHNTILPIAVHTNH